MQSPVLPSVPPGSDPSANPAASATAPAADSTPAAPESTSRRRFRTLLQPFAASRRIAAPIIWFFLDWFVLVAAIATMLVVDSIWVRIFASLVAALWIARLFVIGHDACHGSYTPRKRLNAWIGRIAFLPSLTPYSLWEVGHNLAHHGFTNLKGRDYVWTPFTREEFMKLSWLRRQMEKLYRSGFGQGVYYMIELWWKKLFFPTREHVGSSRKSFTWDSLLVAAFGALWIGGLVAWAIVSHRSVVSMLIFGFAIPFFVWNCLMGFVIHVQHTHPRVAWYERKEEWSSNAGYATTTVHIKLMRPLDGLIHYILEHGAHHVNMGIPLYRLKEAQARLSATLDERLNSEVFTWRYYWNTVRRCKLYDYARHVWTDYEGRVTSEPVVQPLAQ
jgi:omega-6 fatty acid desaturase (delta-12 desaturase)